jgi:putative (di)nucleoside polyphosphate hydrolase
MSHLPLRPNVCLFIQNNDKFLFLGERVETPGHWQLPQGGVKQQQTVQEAAIEEAFEELGARRDLFKIVGMLEYTHSYEWERIPPQYQKVYRGQHQNFMVLQFLGQDTDIQVDWCSLGIQQNTATEDSEILKTGSDQKGSSADVEKDYVQEFSDWRWVAPSDLLICCAPLRRKGYKGALEEYLKRF